MTRQRITRSHSVERRGGIDIAMLQQLNEQKLSAAQPQQLQPTFDQLN